MAAEIPALVEDLAAERDDLDRVLATLNEDDWTRQTPAQGWMVIDQVTHLAYFDDQTRLAIEAPAEFGRSREKVRDVGEWVDDIAAAQRDRRGADARRWLQDAGSSLGASALAADPTVRVPWYGPDMSLASSLTARVMETWAHGQDIVDTFGMKRDPSARLNHVVFLGVRAFANSFRTHGLAVPDVEIRVELTGPDGALWAYGPENAAQIVRGPALDFALVVTQRRHRSDTELSAVGPIADQWLDLAQAFAGPPGAGRERLE